MRECDAVGRVEDFQVNLVEVDARLDFITLTGGSIHRGAETMCYAYTRAFYE